MFSKMSSKYYTLLLFVWVVLVVLADQYTKQWAEETLFAHKIVVTSFLDWRLAYNSGAAFSLFSQFDGGQRYFLVAVSLFASIFLTVLIVREKSRFTALALACILAGAVGNLIDRFFYGVVIDFISLHYGNYYFAIFNIADALISTGAVLLVISWCRQK